MNRKRSLKCAPDDSYTLWLDGNQNRVAIMFNIVLFIDT
jgi:hypothetical protein